MACRGPLLILLAFPFRGVAQEVVLAGGAAPAEVVGQRCGGGNWTGPLTCPEGLFCNHTNAYWWDCQRAPAPDRWQPPPAEGAPVQEALGVPAAAPAQPHIMASTPVYRINARYAHSQVTNDLEAAGVLIHQFHDGTSGDWKPWMPCPPTCNGGPCWCAPFGDRFSATLLTAMMPREKGAIGMYSLENPGFILAPWAMKVRCAYPADGGSEGKNCKPEDGAGCIAGCGGKWCQRDANSPWNMDTSCAWQPTELSHVLELQAHGGSKYNEVVLDADTWVKNLPGSIEAIFYVKGSNKEEEARKVHEMFLAEFAEKSLEARLVPLLELDTEAAGDPFTDVTASRLAVQQEFAALPRAVVPGGPVLGATALLAPGAAVVAALAAVAAWRAVSPWQARWRCLLVPSAAEPREGRPLAPRALCGLVAGRGTAPDAECGGLEEALCSEVE